ncbi:RNA-directed DNA polymerase (Reverse transcriptase) [Trifolium medium]|uniref:RNA-directed DNA polymerase (Reverse transcriptase) n=1 Tax=Trifolium medium TaxID=97028 RepID=A0A392MXC6_9FABA|nr:RNA-directed DNA polymerase (Reverse transcriptase) [Trifolium medium]
MKFMEDMMKRRGFSNIWVKWMRACGFNSTMSVLVNGSPTVDFKAGKGLRQGDPLSPFLFLIAAEGLYRMVNRAVEVDHYKGFKVSDIYSSIFYNLRTIQFSSVKTIGQIYGVLSPF